MLNDPHIAVQNALTSSSLNTVKNTNWLNVRLNFLFKNISLWTFNFFFRYFVGSYESTFSFRIQEEREILGFDPDTTFNRLCPDNDSDCEKPSIWKIVY